MTAKPFSMSKWALAAMVVLCWALATSFMTGYYYYEYSDLLAKVKTSIITASLGINFGNGSTIRWSNDTKINAGSTLLDLTKLVSSVNYTGGTSGAFVNVIDGVGGSDSKYWLWFTHSSLGWQSGGIGCDKYIIGDNETLVWSHQVFSSDFIPP